LKEGRALEAIAALEDILEKNGAHNLADNAMYWIGWAHAQRGDHKLAVDTWQRLPLRYPRSAKVADALFGMAASHEALGEPAVAETLYEQLVAQHPKAEKVRDAKKALARLRPR
jgi:TolA-binding protein